MDKLKNNFTYIALIGTILFVLVIYFVVRPIVNDIFLKVSDVQTAENAYKDTEKEKQIYSEIEKNKDNINSFNKILGLYLPENSSSAEFVIQFTKTAEVNNIILQKLSIENNPKGGESVEAANSDGTDNANPVPSSLEPTKYNSILTGNFVHTINFLKELEKMNRINSIGNIAVSESSGILEIKISGAIYHKSQVTFTGEIANISAVDEKIIKALENVGQSDSKSVINTGRSDPFTQ